MIKSTFYIIPSEYDAQHHGVLGMKWGVRRYQPYSVVPRGSGKGGEEIGDAARYGKGDIKAAKKNINSDFKNAKSNNQSSDIKIEREKSSNGKYSWMSTTIKDEKGKSSYEVTATDDYVSDDYFKKTAKDFSSKKDVIKKYAMEAIIEDPYIYNSWAKNLGMSKDQFRNSLDIKSVYMGRENGMVEVSVWEKDDSGSILGYHSLDMDFDLNNLKKPKYVSMNG